MAFQDAADDLQDRALDLVLEAQEALFDVLEKVVHAIGLPSQPAMRFADYLPQMGVALDRGIEQAERWLQTQRGVGSRLAERLATAD